MTNFNSINEVLDFAIEQEQKAIDFYSRLAKETNSNDIKNIYLDFVKEEMGHKIKLLNIKKEGIFAAGNAEEVQNLKISDYLVSVKATPNMSYQDALIVAMKREKSAYLLYKNLAKMAPNEGLKDIFNNLAFEEANHKLQFELEYDEMILKDN